MPDVGSVKYKVKLDDSSVEQQAEKTEKTIVSKLGGVVGKVGAGLAAGAGVAAAGLAVAGKKVVDFANDVSSAGDEIDKMSQKIGISTDAYQEWSYVFERSGADVNNLQTGMKTLSSVITDAANGSESAATKLSAIGVSLEEINGLSQEDQLSLVISRLQEMGEGSERTAAATDLLGRSATDMAAVLNMTAEDTQALIDEAHEYGMVMSGDAVAASAAYQDSMTKLQGTIGGLKNQLVADLLPGLTQVVDGLADVANGSTSLEDAIDSGISAVIESLDSSLPDMIDRGVQIVTSVADGIANNLPKILDAAGKIVAKIVEGIIAVLPTLLSAAVQIIASLASYIIQNIPTLASAALEVVLGLVRFLIDNGPQILQAGIELVGKLVAGLIQAIPKVAEGVQKIIQKIKDKFADIDWGEVGRSIIDGIKNGIAGAASSIGEAVSGLGRGLLSKAKRTLKISSPSKVFRDEVGKMIPAGMAEGIEDGEPEVESSMDKLLRGFTADVDYNLPNLSSYAQELGASINASTSTQITVPVTLDGREIARATAWYTNEQLAWEARG
jgi:hypothetical protein